MLAVLALVACVDPAAYGAIPDDGVSDTAAIQKAIDAAIVAGADVCLGPGVFTLDRTSQIGSLTITGGPLVIHGAGETRTHLRMSGSGHKGDWRAIELTGGHDVVLRDLAIDGLDAVETEEQTHLVEIGPDSHDVILAHVTLGPMRRPDQRVGQGIGGDCVRLLGASGHEVQRVLIADTRFVDCDRSGVMFQRGLRNITVVRSQIIGTGDTPIDFEPTGNGTIEDVTLADLQIHRPVGAQGAYAMTIAGGKGGKRIVIARSVLDGGGIAIANFDDVEILDNQITNGPGIEATMSMFRRVNRVHIARNAITRVGSAKPGPLIRSAHNNGAIPHGLVIEDNTLAQGTSAPVLALESTNGVVLHHNDITYGGAEPRAIVDVQAIAGDIDDLVVDHNTVRGPAAQLVRLVPRTHDVEVDVFDNAVDGTAIGVTCSGDPARFRGVHLAEPSLGDECKRVKTLLHDRRGRKSLISK